MQEGTVFARGGRLRAPWRIAAYFALFFVFLIVGQYAASVLPREPLNWATWIMAVASSLAAGWIALARFDARPLGALGFAWHAEAVRDSLRGLLFGGGLLGLTVMLLVVTGTAHFAPDGGSVPEYGAELGVTLVYFGVAAAAEELWFRGYAFQAAVEWAGTWPAVLVSSGLFSVFHASNPGVGWIAFANIFLAGVLLALVYLRTRSLWAATAVHLGWNWVMASLLDFRVSGLTFDTPLYDAVSTGPTWWTGGDFGPEAGLAGTLALVGGIVWLLRTDRVVESAHMRALSPLVDQRLGPDEP